jgi:hypothetical protein
MKGKMQSTVRRQVYELTLSDLDQFPVWEFAQDEETVEEQDEATVRPYSKVPVDPSDGLQVIRATFTLADGTKLIGFVSSTPPTLQSDISSQQPVILLEKVHILLYFGIFRPDAAKIDSYLYALGKSAAEVFPLRYKTEIDVIGGCIEGAVAGFSYLKDGEIKTIYA